MRRTITRASWSLLAAGALGITGPAMAQFSPTSSQVPSGHSQRLVRADEHAVLPADAYRTEEIQVELAWLANPAIFSCNLEAHGEGNGLELRGCVPSEGAREIALRLARTHTRLSVVDALVVNPEVISPMQSVTPTFLEQGARDLLSEVLGDEAKHLSLKAVYCGEVTVRGSVHSLEEKLAVSRQLKRLRGCLCVTNLLLVTAAEPIVRQAPKSTPTVAVMPREKVRTSPPPAAVAPTIVRTSATMPAPTLPARNEVTAPPVTGNSSPTVPSSGAPRPLSSALVAKPLPEVTPTPIPTSKNDKPYVSSGVLLISTDASTASPIVRTSTTTPSTNRPAVIPATVPEPKWAPAKVDKPYVSSGVVLMSNDTSAAPEVEKAGATPLTLKKLLETVCGPTARDIEVVSQKGNHLVVRFKVANKAEGEAISAKILGLPELQTFQFSFQMQVAP